MEENKKKMILQEALEYLKAIVITVVIVLLINNFVLINALVPSESMEKTIMTGDRIFGFRLAYKFNDPERFDIIIFRYPDDPSKLYIKRLIGLPGETVEIREGKVYIDGADTPLDDSFCPEEPAQLDFGPYEVPEDGYFMMGDNRNHSEDSRYWENTYVDRDQIIGKAIVRYFPSIKKLFD